MFKILKEIIISLFSSERFLLKQFEESFIIVKEIDNKFNDKVFIPKDLYLILEKKTNKKSKIGSSILISKCFYIFKRDN